MQPQLMKWHWKTIVSIVISSISVALLLVSAWSIFFCVAPWCSMLVMNGLSFSTLPYIHGFIIFQSKVVLLKKILGKLYYSVHCDQHKCKFKGLAIEKNTCDRFVIWLCQKHTCLFCPVAIETWITNWETPSCYKFGEIQWNSNLKVSWERSEFDLKTVFNLKWRKSKTDNDFGLLNMNIKWWRTVLQGAYMSVLWYLPLHTEFGYLSAVMWWEKS